MLIQLEVPPGTTNAFDCSLIPGHLGLGIGHCTGIKGSYSHVVFNSRIGQRQEPVVVAMDTQVSGVERELGKAYRSIGAHRPRPGEVLVMYLRRDLKIPAFDHN